MKIRTEAMPSRSESVTSNGLARSRLAPRRPALDGSSRSLTFGRLRLGSTLARAGVAALGIS